MKSRCPSAEVYGTSVIHGYRMLFKQSMTGAYATIEQDADSQIPVVIYRVTAEDEARLDRFEGCPCYYRKQEFLLPVWARNGKKRKRRSSCIMCILENEVYTGDKLLQKHAPKNFLTKEPENGIEYESNYLTDDHEPIVDRGTWQKAQELLKARREELDSGRIKYSSVRTHFLYGKVICGDCGSLMTRRTLRCTSRKDCKDNYKAWSCKDRHEGRRGNGCRMRNIREAGLLAEIAAQIGCRPGGKDSVHSDRDGLGTLGLVREWRRHCVCPAYGF